MIENILGKIVGGRVLDVATRDGHFVQLLMKYLKSYSEILGIDIDAGAIETASGNLSYESVQFLVMDAEKIAFENGSFDTVNISASLHHIANISRVLGEMARVLNSGGKFIVLEMHSDGRTEAELTSIYLHHWVAEIDTELGNLHNHTLPRQKILDYVNKLGLSEVSQYDYRDEDSDPMERSRIEGLENLIEKTLQRAENTINYPAFAERGNELRQRLHEVGAQREPRLVLVGEK